MSALDARRGRRTVVAGLTLALGSSLALLPAPAHAAPITFTVIGTSDVSDSNLVFSVIEPRFEAQYPQYDLKYVAQGTGAAITSARAGNAAAIIVHAASIENQFVADGYSLEPAGRLIFWGDYVLAGPASDPAGVLTGAPHDIVGAFEKIAAAGAAGTADFVSRGGTPGTAAQERLIWSNTTGVPTCTVGNPSGGGTRPKDPASASTLCTNPDDITYNPGGGDSDGAPFPSWYHTGNASSQATNVNIANTCSFSSGKCYVFTDRGTLAYLQSQGGAQNLKILTRDNAPTARGGGRDALINVFHAYGVNPAKFADPSVTKTDPVAAKLFLDFMTQPSTQAAMGEYLRTSADQVFLPASAPTLTGAFSSTQAVDGKPTKITGNLANVVPGYPALGGVTVNLLEAASDSPLSFPKILGSTTTDAAGNYTFSQKLTGGKNYRVGVGPITKLELPALSPSFSDILAGTTTTVGSVGGVTAGKATPGKKGRFSLPGKVAPAVDGTGTVTVLAVKKGAKKGAKAKKIGTVKLRDGQSRFTFKGHLARGSWKLQLVYANPGQVLPGASKTVRVTIR